MNTVHSEKYKERVVLSLRSGNHWRHSKKRGISDMIEKVELSAVHRLSQNKFICLKKKKKPRYKWFSDDVLRPGCTYLSSLKYENYLLF